jgi:hypothetical protein
MKKARFQGTALGGHKDLAVEVPFDPAEKWSVEPQKLWKGAEWPSRPRHGQRSDVRGRDRAAFATFLSADR